MVKTYWMLAQCSITGYAKETRNKQIHLYEWLQSVIVRQFSNCETIVHGAYPVSYLLA